MRKSITAKRGRKRKTQSTFQPNSNYVESAVDQFLQSGGKITKVVDLEDHFESFVGAKEGNSADSFLLGR